MTSSPTLGPVEASRQDPSDDANFHAAPRFVTRIDDGAIRAVGALAQRHPADPTRGAENLI